MGKEIQNTGQIVSNSFSKGLNKDTDPSFVESGLWIHARNAVNNTDEGNLGTLSNEDSNLFCPSEIQFCFKINIIIFSVNGYDDLTKCFISPVGCNPANVLFNVL